LQDVIAKLSEIGYFLSLDGDKVKFRYGLLGEPPEEARGLLTELKAYKKEAVTFLRSKDRGSGTLFDRPISIESRHLDGAIVYLVRDDEMASEVERKGLVAFTKAEIRAMAATERSMEKEEWISYLKAIYQTKKEFEGAKVV
jgi:hypothetical protein